MLIALLASLTAVGPLPAWTYPDTEVTTNVVHRFADPNASEFRLALAATATPTNAVTVAFGRDRNENGVLELEETALRLGWDCGDWFAEGAFPADAKVVPEEPAGPDEKRLTISWLLHGQSLDWDLFRVTVRGIEGAALAIETGTRAAGLAIRIK